MQYFNNQLYVEPGSAATIVTDLAPSPNLLSSGLVAMIGESDGGLTYADGVIYQSDQPNFLKSAMRSGTTSYRVLDFIFNPSKDTPGAQQVIYVRAQAATVATGTITQVTGGAVTFTMTTKDKGSYLSNPVNGLMWKLVAGVVNTSKQILMLQINAAPLWSSPEVSTYQDLINAIANDSYANTILVGAVTSGTATTVIDASVRTSSYAVLTGGTAPAMVGTDVDGALALLSTLTPNVVYIASEDATLHAKVLSFCQNTLEQPAQCVFGGAYNETVAQVQARALALNNEKAYLCYPDIVMEKTDGSGTEILSPMYHAALVTGLRAGLQPWQPLTWKTINVLGFHTNGGDLNKTNRSILINSGVIYSRNIPGVGFGINKGINTLQSNGSMIYKDSVTGQATSPESSIISIKYQLIRELAIGSAPLFVGGTAATVTQEDVINFTENYLISRCSTPTQPNLIQNFAGVTANLVNDAWMVYFGFTPNTPINFMFFTGAMLKP